MEDRQQPYVRICSHDTRGKILVATQELQPGQTIIQEDPLILVDGDDPEEAYAAYQAFLQQSPEVKNMILGLYCPLDGPTARKLQAAACAVENVKDLQEFVKVALVFNFNSFYFSAKPGSNAGVGIFATACRASHSCQPNCCWTSDMDQRIRMRTLTPVAAGEELTFDYNEPLELQPMHQRRAELLVSKEFFCECPRCCAPGDDTRRFPCEIASCEGHHLVHQPTAEDQPTLLTCSSCNTQPTAAYTARMLRSEEHIAMLVRGISDDVDSGGYTPDLEFQIGQLQPPHPHHYLAEEIGRRQWELYNCQAEHEKAACAARVAVECRDAIIQYPSSQTAYICQYMGDSLTASAQSSSKVQLLLLQAQEAYQRALKLFTVTDGPSAQTTATAASKLRDVQAAAFNLESHHH